MDKEIKQKAYETGLKAESLAVEYLTAQGSVKSDGNPEVSRGKSTS